MAFPHGMTPEEAQNFRRDRQIEELQRATELITQQLARLLDDKPRTDSSDPSHYSSENLVGRLFTEEELGMILEMSKQMLQNSMEDQTRMILLSG
jgi:hypothetical protein